MHTVLAALRELQNGRSDKRFSSLEILDHLCAPIDKLNVVEYILFRQFEDGKLNVMNCPQSKRVKYGYSNRIVADASNSSTPQQSTQTMTMNKETKDRKGAGVCRVNYEAIILNLIGLFSGIATLLVLIDFYCRYN